MIRDGDRAMIAASMDLLNEAGGRALATLAQLVVKNLAMLDGGAVVRIIRFSSNETAAAWDRAVDDGHVIEVTVKRGHGRDQAFMWIEARSRYYENLPAHVAGGSGKVGGGRERVDQLGKAP